MKCGQVEDSISINPGCEIPVTLIRRSPYSITMYLSREHALDEVTRKDTIIEGTLFINAVHPPQ